jgi:hypothetical protein
MIRTLPYALALLLAWINTTTTAAASCFDRYTDRLRSIALITGHSCSLLQDPCVAEERDKVGTGFLIHVPDFDEPVILTAYHIVAGAQRQSYQFTARPDGSEITDTTILAINPAFDIALLRAQSKHLGTRQPLELTTSLPRQRQIIAFGHKSKLPRLQSDEGIISLEAAGTFNDFIVGRAGKELIERLPFPDRDLPVVGLEEILAPGDSGAPVFSCEDGKVIGMGHGGLPSALGQVSWMIATDTLEKGFRGLEQFDRGNDISAAWLEFNYSSQLFVDGLTETVTPISSTPKVRFQLEFDGKYGPFAAYGKRLHEAGYDRDNDWREDPNQVGALGTRLVDPASAFFLSPTIPAPTCSNGVPCQTSNMSEGELLKLLNGTTLSMDCYREPDFLKVLLSDEPRYIQPSLEIGLKFQDIATSIEKERIELGFSDLGVSEVRFTLSSDGFVEAQPGIDEFSQHPDVNNLEDLYGGACQIELTHSAMSDFDAIRALNTALERGGICLHFILANGTHTPVGLVSKLPIKGNPGYGGFWGLLPVIKDLGSYDDAFCH